MSEQKLSERLAARLSNIYGGIDREDVKAVEALESQLAEAIRERDEARALLQYANNRLSGFNIVEAQRDALAKALEPFIKYHNRRMEITNHALESVTENGGVLKAEDWESARRALGLEK